MICDIWWDDLFPKKDVMKVQWFLFKVSWRCLKLISKHLMWYNIGTIWSSIMLLFICAMLQWLHYWIRHHCIRQHRCQVWQPHFLPSTLLAGQPPGGLLLHMTTRYLFVMRWCGHVDSAQAQFPQVKMILFRLSQLAWPVIFVKKNCGNIN